MRSNCRRIGYFQQWHNLLSDVMLLLMLVDVSPSNVVTCDDEQVIVHMMKEWKSDMTSGKSHMQSLLYPSGAHKNVQTL